MVQEVFLALWNKRSELTITVSLSSYLYRATKNRVLNYIAHENVIAKHAESIAHFVEKDYLIEDSTSREKQLQVIIKKEIAALPDKMREVFILRKVEELSYTEIGKQLKISDKTAKQQVYNALNKLRNKLVHLQMFSF